MIQISRSDSNLQAILNTLSQASENAKFRSKSEERKTLTELNKLNRYKIEGSINTADKKCFVLYQASMSWSPIENWMLKKVQTELAANAWRVLHCMREYFLYKKNVEGIINSTLLNRGIQQQLWPDSDLVLYQLPKIGEKMTNLLREHGISSFEDAIKRGPREIERICGKKPPFGNQLIQCIEAIPSYSIIHRLTQKKSFIELQISLTQENTSSSREFRTLFFLIIYIKSSKYKAYKLLDCKRISEEKKQREKSITINISSEICGKLYINLLCDKFVGIDRKIVVPDISRAVGRPCTCSLDDPGTQEIELLLTEQIEETKNTPGTTKFCNHKCKDKRKCKHACCKLHLENNGNLRQSTLEQWQGGKFTPTQSPLSTSSMLSISQLKSNSPENYILTPESQLQYF